MNSKHHFEFMQRAAQCVAAQDLRDLEHVREISLIELLVDRLPSRVGSPLSVNNLAQDLQVNHKTVERWLQILESLYLCFRVAPYGAPRVRAVKKERKLYLWDWSCVEDAGPRFENLVGAQLLKYCHFIEDTEGWPMELRFLRDSDRRELDFVVMRKGKPLFAVECKVSARQADGSLAYFAERAGIPRLYLVHLGQEHFERGRITVLRFVRFCTDLSMP